MAKLKDGFYKLTASSIGSDLLVLLAGGGAKPISDFALFNNAYWANIPISNTSSTTTTPTFGNASIKGGDDTGLNLYTSAAYTRIRFYNASSVNNATIHYFGTAYSGYDFVKDSLNLGCLGLVTLGGWNNPTLVVSSNTTTSNSDGKVGIGTTSPKYKLDVNGALRANGNVLLEAANNTTGGGIAFWDASGWVNGTINAKNLILNYAGGNVGIGILSPKAKLHVNGHTLINKRLTIGEDLGVWDPTRAEIELISPSGLATDFWMGSGQRDWSISTRTPSENSVLCLYAYTTSANAVVTIEKSGNTTIRGNLNIGASDTRNYIAFRGTTGDNPGDFNHTYIGENIWGSSESSELVLFKGNDVGTTAVTVSGSGADRIRHIAGGHLFQIYKSALSGTFADICTSTVPVNMLAIHLDSIQTYAPLVIVGEKYSGNYGINMLNSDIVGINAMYTQDNAEDGGEGLQFSRGNGYYDSIWASGGVLYFSPNGNLNRSGSYSNNYTVLHTGNYTGTLDGRYVNVTGDTMTGNLVIGNTTIYASGTNGGTNSLAVADDCILGDCNVGGVLGLKATNATIAGIKFFNSSSTSLGLLTAVNSTSVKWNDYTIWHSGNDGSGSGLDADTVDGIHASGFILTNSLMIHGAYAVIPTYNGETGWHRIATIDGGTGYGSWILYLCGDWSWASNTTAILHINTRHTTAKITQVSGIVGFVTDVRLVPISANNYYVDVYINYSGANTPGTVYCYFLGNGAITTRTTAEKITASVSTAASITLVTGTRTNDNSYAAHFYENSDVMLKTNIKSITDSDNMPILKSFDWKSDGSRGYGLIAQELEAMGYPELVSGELDGTKTVNYSAALSLIVGKLQVKIKELEKEIEILKNKN